MADGHGHLRFVKLTKDQGPVDDITPGELNQPIQVPQATQDSFARVLFGRNIETLTDDIPWTNACVCHAMCIEGGMALAAATALFHGIDPRTSFLIWQSLFLAWWMSGIYTGLFRQSLQKKYHLKNSPCDPCLVHCRFHWCALCQEHREMKNHLSDNAETSMTVVSPPQTQEMNTGENRKSATAPSTGNEGHTNLELQPV
ncbi:hypothetical protein LWI29_016727 [Acer saccharum]|uniref:Uncharacterized protein n=1 Tax=Acer saccharum TaxID=4024 RepID=A0AA39VT80_ACESA|nr:hypothetical protein LWI29_016727 [Acer saccharum]